MAVRIVVDGVDGGRLPADDPGFTLGLNVFETFRSYGRAVFRLDQHLDRLAGSAAHLDIVMPPIALLRREIAEVLLDDVQVRLTLTAGGHRVLELRPIDPARVGAAVTVARQLWQPAQGLPGLVKHGNRAFWHITARRAGVDELLLVDPAGNILEASRSSVVAALEGALVTPPADGRILAGVTRGALLDAAEAEGLPLRVAPVPADAPLSELYLCSTLKELAPVTRIGAEVAPGAGPLGAALHAALRRLIARECGDRSVIFEEL